MKMSVVVTFILLASIFSSSCSQISLFSHEEEKHVDEKLENEKTSHDSEVTHSETHKDIEPAPRVAVSQTDKLSMYCKKIDKKFKKLGWGKSNCESYDWNHVRNSVKGDPLIWKVYGNENAHKQERKNMTMILCGVHGDEITPIKFCFDVMKHLDEHLNEIGDKLVVVAPIVNPDSFFPRRSTRTNANGVDINRNFPTKDWYKDAIRLWKRRYRSDKRRNPGKYPLSEPEVLFQVNLIKRYSPDKIISVHAPLTILDYDGPRDHQSEGHIGNVANQLLIQMSQQAKGYRVKNYPFFPGSLGNYAGNERKIPTYTLELPSSDYTKSDSYWALFKEAIHSAVLHDFRPKVAMEEQEEKSSTNRNN